MPTSRQTRLLQFAETLVAASAAYDSLHQVTKDLCERRFLGLGTYLRSMSDGLADGICEALEQEHLIYQRKTGRWASWWGLGSRDAR
jgi:hypothetical protein